MTIIFQLIQYHLKSISRNLYWLYRLSQIKFGKRTKLFFPIEIEGKGSVAVESDCTINKNVKIGVGDQADLKVGENSFLDKNGVILIGNTFSLRIGKNFKLGRNARLYIKNHWVFGDNVHIETYSSVFAREPGDSGQLIIGNNSTIGDYTIIDVVDDVFIGNDVAIGPNCTLYTHDHIYTDKNVPAWKGGLVSKPIEIEDGAWIGSGVTILPGVTVGKRAVIAAGSVVTKSVESNVVYGGIPAKRIKTI